MAKISIICALLSALIVSCTGDSPDDCAFQAPDGSCAVTARHDGSFDCNLSDKALCATITAYLETGKGEVGSTSAALINTGARIGGGGGLNEYCEPPGTFMCTCCDVHYGCKDCPKPDPIIKIGLEP